MPQNNNNNQRALAEHKFLPPYAAVLKFVIHVSCQVTFGNPMSVEIPKHGRAEPQPSAKKRTQTRMHPDTRHAATPGAAQPIREGR